MTRVEKIHIILAIGIALVLIVGALTLPQFAHAQPDQIVPVDCDGPDCNLCHLATLFQNVLNFAVYFASIVAAILFAWAGLLYLTNRVGDTGKVERAKKVFLDVAIGFLIVLAAWLIVDTIMKTLIGGNFGPWNELCDQNSTSSITF